jgi:pimeloyl-ACP methyl ester carboxylesterase
MTMSSPRPSSDAYPEPANFANAAAIRLFGTLFPKLGEKKPLPTMWKEFDALAQIPMMVICGNNSDVLSTATVAAMQARYPALRVVAVADQGHVPLLAEADVIGRIAAFVAAGDRGP